MGRQSFGGSWTDEKLERLRKYLEAYMTIFTSNIKAKYLTPIYVDAFAGTGYRTNPERDEEGQLLFPELVEEEPQDYLKGSVKIALEIPRPFARYIFIERDPAYAQELRKLQSEHPNAHIEIISKDANEYLKSWCDTLDRYDRAVVFLDPYGMQVEWNTVEAIARTQKIDLWILFPLGVAVNRLLPREDLPPPVWAQRLTQCFGTDEWKEAFYTTKTKRSLFGPETESKKTADIQAIIDFFQSRLRKIFVGAARNPLPLRNSRNSPLYLLCFAAGHPRGAKTAIKIAEYILK